jgi:hypothetical protein
MQPSSQQLLTCPTCGAALEETFGGGGGCMFCLLQAGIASEEETVHDSTLTPRAVNSRDPFARVQVLDELFVDARIDHYSQVQKLPPDKTEARSAINMPYKDA